MDHDIVSCGEAARTIRGMVGIGALAPATSALLATYDRCDGHACGGNHVLSVIAEAQDAAAQDAILALRN